MGSKRDSGFKGGMDQRGVGELDVGIRRGLGLLRSGSMESKGYERI